MEYIHAYGWILISVLMLSGVALYYNISREQYLIPLECSFLSGLNCLDASTDETLFYIDIVNEFGFALSNITLDIVGTCNSTANTTDGNPYGNLNVLLENKQSTYTFECQNLTNMRVTELINVTYINVETGRQHHKVGKLEYSPTGQ